MTPRFDFYYVDPVSRPDTSNLPLPADSPLQRLGSTVTASIRALRPWDDLWIASLHGLRTWRRPTADEPRHPVTITCDATITVMTADPATVIAQLEERTAEIATHHDTMRLRIIDDLNKPGKKK